MLGVQQTEWALRAPTVLAAIISYNRRAKLRGPFCFAHSTIFDAARATLDS